MNEQLLQEFKTFQATYAEKFGTIDSELKRHEALLRNCEQELTRPAYHGGGGQETKSLAELVWANEGYQHWARNGAKGRFALSVGGDEFKTAITSSSVGSSTPGILVPERTPGIVTSPVRKTRVRDLIPAYPTGNNACEHIRESAFTNAASPVAETISKPESAASFSIESAPVRTLATWIPATKQVLDDFRELAPYLNVRLIQKLKDIEDWELLSGDGTGVHIAGLLTEATSFDTGRSEVGDTRLDTLSHALSQLEESEYDPDGIVMNPADWRRITRIKTEPDGANTGSYLAGSPLSSVPQMLWGKSVAITTAMSAGCFLVGAFQMAAAIRDRLGATIDISDSHDQFFIENKVAIRCEERLALQIFQPGALVYGEF